MIRRLLSVLAVLAAAPVAADDWRLSGSISGQLDLYPNPPLYAGQARNDASLAAEPELYREWNDGALSFTFVPFYRWDSAGGKRTHGDIRELNVYLRQGDWEGRLGIGKVFWGVAESNHLVDVVNQIDGVEDLDGEDKLGQPMLNLATSFEWGDVEYYLLPLFRERNWPGVPDRMRFALPVDESLTRYESERENRHIDHALRVSATLGDLDLGVSAFVGTARMPRMIPAVDAGGALVLAPYYEQARRLGLDAQWIVEDWTWKLEAIRERRGGSWYSAAVGGFEYTFYDVAASGWDLGTLLEYSYDSRGCCGPERATTLLQDDLFAGLRLSFNDADSSELLAGLFHDRTLGSEMLRLEASTRIGEGLKLTIEAQGFARMDPRDLAYSMRDDDYLRLELGWYF